MQTQSARAQLKRYAEAVAMWNARFDTLEIAQQLGIAECVVASWVANFRDQMYPQSVA